MKKELVRRRRIGG